ncbi:hypothetical protein [Arenibacter algicola]|jgi:hypothetical protein|uniref:Uncharacterized protein n=1 Tax=Arenibacter algicola TaxID=616991 RepID=A0A221V3A6_9FLAO|nr:hypothetical protein [Arenibacter algicola]ASO07868.1 hypothetical protein AREALGSMS7_04469 [Arenibacter algicola]MDX1759511.1 hypothetical protein [Arenibacter algicola]|tara:strand:- start:579 stop:1097 length:519 start_codon:yes stop_codon:yes gene_type:complete
MDKLNKNNSFGVPDGYFDTFSSDIMKKIAKEDASMPPNEGFKVPEGYFETFNTRLLEQLESTPAETKVIPLKSYKKHYYTAASVAAVVLLFLVVQFNSDKTPSYSDLANSDIENYFEFNDLELTSYDLAEILPIDDLDLNDILEIRLDNDNIIDYLDSHIEDFEELNMHNDD